MQCPSCSDDSTKVEETRKGPDGQIRRYRRCSKCQHRFATIEQLDLGSVRVKKRDGRHETFSKGKLAKSIRKAMVQELPTADLHELGERVVVALFADEDASPVGDRSVEYEPCLISAETIGEKVLEVLGADRRFRSIWARYALLFGAESGVFWDAQSFLAWLTLQGTSTPPVGPTPELVIKRDGAIEPFEERKLSESIRFAAKKKPNTKAEEIASDQLGDHIYEVVIEAVTNQRLVTSGQLASEVMRALHPDHGPLIPESLLSSGARQLAYLRVASTAKHFGRLEDFAGEAAGLVVGS